MIQNPNIKFSYRVTISLKDTSLNSPFSNLKSTPKTGHHIGSKHGTIPITH